MTLVKNYFYIKLILTLFIFTVSNAFGQSNPHPCSQMGVDCSASSKTGAVFSFQKDNFIYASPNIAMPFWIAAGDKSTGAIDTSHSGPVACLKISGPGSLTGTFTANFTKYHYFTDWKFSKAGTYGIEVNLVGFPKDTVYVTVGEEVDLCGEGPSADCINGAGDAIFTFRSAGIIPVDAIFPITVGVVDQNTGLIDSSFYGTMLLEQVSGPGNMYGTLNLQGSKWVTFTNVKFDAAGTYTVKASAQGLGLTPDIFEVEVSSANSIKEIVDFGILLYPNPTSGVFSLKSNPDYAPSSIRIFDNSGKLIFSKNLESVTTESQIMLPELSSGAYFYELQFPGTFQLDRGILIKK